MKAKDRVLGIIGYLVPLVQTLPPLGVWTSLMTMPLIAYLFVLFTTFPQGIVSEAISFLLSPFLVAEKIVILGGLGLFLYSTVQLYRRRGKGLVTTGCYRVVRHPQYVGAVFMTLGLTSWSYWILTHTFGIGFLTPTQTLVAWMLQLAAYIGIACVEEAHLTQEVGDAFRAYREKVPFYIPMLRSSNRFIEIFYAVVVPVLILSILIVMGR